MAKDEAKAAKWFRKAAQQEHAESQHCLGLLCLDGVGVQQDTAAAAVWFQKAVRPRPPSPPCPPPSHQRRKTTTYPPPHPTLRPFTPPMTQ